MERLCEGSSFKASADSYGSAVNLFLTPTRVLIFRTAYVHRTLLHPDDSDIFSDNEMLYILNSKKHLSPSIKTAKAKQS